MRRRNARKLKFAEQVVVLGQRTLALVDLNQDSGLVIGGGREDLRLLGGDDSVAGDELGEDATSGLDTEGKRADVNEDDIFDTFLARQDTTLDGSTVGDGLIGVDSLGGLLAKVFLDELLDLGDTSRTTDEDNLENPR